MSLANWPNKKRRVVVTGMGIITPLGHTLSDTWKALLADLTGAVLPSGNDTAVAPF